MAVGKTGAKGGLLTPGIRPIIACDPTNMAPVLPAETKASASPALTRFIATTMDESFFLRIAFTGCSAVSITSVAPITSILLWSYVYLLNSASTASLIPTSLTVTHSLLLTASTTPLTIAAGALSPPIASTATVIALIIFHAPKYTYLYRL